MSRREARCMNFIRFEEASLLGLRQLVHLLNKPKWLRMHKNTTTISWIRIGPRNVYIPWLSPYSMHNTRSVSVVRRAP